MAKGLSVAENYPESLIISGDTVVSIDDRILGKPENEDDAFQMLLNLNGRTHQVYTGYGLFLKDYEMELVNYAVTDVTFRNLLEEDIRNYIRTGEPFDKAGGYGIQGKGSLLVKEINGCFFNVMGFPVSQFYVDLGRFLKNVRL
jgi:septum formation protein